MLLTQYQVDLIDEQDDLPSRIRHLLQQRLQSAHDSNIYASSLLDPANDDKSAALVDGILPPPPDVSTSNEHIPGKRLLLGAVVDSEAWVPGRQLAAAP